MSVLSQSDDRPQVFISYQSDSLECAQRLRDLLVPDAQAAPFRVRIMNNEGIPHSKEWDHEIKEVIESAFVAICILTRKYFESPYIREQEIPPMVRRYDSDGGKSLPLLLLFENDCEKEFKDSPLSRFQAITTPREYYWKEKDRKAIEIALAQDVKDAYWNWLCSDAAPPPWEISSPPENFLGRDKERKELESYIREGGFVVVNGSPRSGRRALARFVARDLRAGGVFRGGVEVDCSSIENHDDLVRKVAAAVLRGQEQIDPATCARILKEHFARRRLLVVLDATGNKDKNKDDVIVQWARQMPVKSCAVYLPFNQMAELRRVHVPPSLDVPNAIELFRWHASVANGNNDYRDPQSMNLISQITSQLHFYPLLIELFAKKCGERMLLVHILDDAKQSAHKAFEDVWGEQLRIRFAQLADDYRQAFLRLSRLPAAISDEVARCVTKTCTVELGKAVGQQLLWAPGPYDRYYIDGYVRDFAKAQFGGQNEISEADKLAAAGFACAAKEQAGLIDRGRREGQEIAEAAFDWFELEWPNVIWCWKVARKSDVETLCRLSDSLIQFMLSRGHLDDCWLIYKDVEKRRRVLSQSGTRDDRLAHSQTLNDMAVCQQYRSDFVEADLNISDCIAIRDKELTALPDGADIACERFRLAQSHNTHGAIKELHAWSLVPNRDRTMSPHDRQRITRLLHEATTAYEEAHRNCVEASEACAPESDIEREIEIELSQTLSNLGQSNARLFWVLSTDPWIESDPQLVAERMNRRDKAEGAFRNSLKIRRLTDWRRWQTLSRQAWLYGIDGNWPRAKALYREALQGIGKNPFEKGLALRGFGEALVHIPPHDYVSGLQYYAEARDTFGTVYLRERYEVSMEMVRTERERGDEDRARELADEAQAFAAHHNLTV